MVDTPGARLRNEIHVDRSCAPSRLPFWAYNETRATSVSLSQESEG